MITIKANQGDDTAVNNLKLLKKDSSGNYTKKGLLNNLLG